MNILAESLERLAVARSEREAKRAKSKPPRSAKQKFYASVAWRRLRYKVIVEQAGKCQACGRSRKDGIVLHVDHILPLSKYWDRRLDRTNVQLLCDDCNIAKSNLSTEDWR